MPKVTQTAPKPGPPGKAVAVASKAVAPDDEIVEGEIIEDWFVSLDDTTDYVNVVFYGREGAAKTTNAARLANIPGNGKVLFINAEGGLKLVPLRKRGVDTSSIVVWPNPQQHQRAGYAALDRIYRQVSADLRKDPNSWKGIVIDSVSELHQAVLDDVQAKRVQRAKDKGAEPDENHVDIADYGDMSKQVRDLLRKFRDLPCHVVFTALERRDVDKDTGKPQYGPAITPGLQVDLLGYVDFVLMCKPADEDGPYRALTRANSRYRAKDRFDVLPRVMADPFMDRIIGYLSGQIDEANDPVQDQIDSGGIDAPPNASAETEDPETDNETESE